MSLLFTTEFLGHPLHVLDIRGRTAFLAVEVGAAAGYLFGGDRFVTLLTREWAESLEDDEDVVFLTGRDLDRVRREVGLPVPAEGLVIFRSGIHKALVKSSARHARALLRYLEEDVYPVAAAERTVRRADGYGGDDGPTSSPEAVPVEPSPDLAMDESAERIERAAFVRRCTEYLALRRYARLLLVHENDVRGYLMVEQIAIESLLGRGLWSDPPPSAPAAASVKVAA